MKKFLIKSSFVLISLLALAIIATFFLIMETKPTISDETNNWSMFYKNTVSQTIILPNNIALLKATYVQGPFMGSSYKIIFQLPLDKSPSEWLSSIVNESGIERSFRVNEHLYDCLDKCDLLKIEYLPENEYYEISAGWD